MDYNKRLTDFRNFYCLTTWTGWPCLSPERKTIDGGKAVFRVTGVAEVLPFRKPVRGNFLKRAAERWISPQPDEVQILVSVVGAQVGWGERSEIEEQFPVIGRSRKIADLQEEWVAAYLSPCANGSCEVHPVCRVPV